MGEGANLGHIRIFAFDQQTLKQVGFSHAAKKLMIPNSPWQGLHE